MTGGEYHHVAGQRIYRFVWAERFAHWLNAATFFLLAVTGAILLVRYPLGLSPRTVHYLHESHFLIGLIYFLGPAAVMLSGNPHAARHWMVEAIRWSRTDLLWMLGPLQRLFLPRGATLKVGRFNAGQRMNMAFQIVGKWGLFVTGLVMYFIHGSIVMYALHLLFAFVLLFVVAGHIYMATLHPSTRPALSAMLSGYVDAEWLRHHHPGWFEELIHKQNPVRQPAPKAQEPPAEPGPEMPLENDEEQPVEGPP